MGDLGLVISNVLCLGGSGKREHPRASSVVLRNILGESPCGIGFKFELRSGGDTFGERMNVLSHGPVWWCGRAAVEKPLLYNGVLLWIVISKTCDSRSTAEMIVVLETRPAEMFEPENQILADIR